MNYRHIYHAGSFADVVKHAVLTLIVEHLKGKTAPFAVIDTHAGIANDLTECRHFRLDHGSQLLGRAADGFDAGGIEPRIRIGTAEHALDLSVARAKERVTFKKPIAERQAIQWMLADSATELSMARAYAYETLRRLHAGEDVSTAASMCKLYCSEMVGRVADRAVQIHGGMGLVRGFSIERFYRDVRHYRVGEGSSEIQRMLIARDLLK